MIYLESLILICVNYQQICYSAGYIDYILDNKTIQLIFTSDKYDLSSTYILSLYTIHLDIDTDVNIN